VQCDICEKWIHQICGLFNTRQNKEHHSEYCCPLCLVDKYKKNPIAPPPRPPGAVDLPRTKLSEYLENHLARRIAQRRRSLAEEKQKTEVCLSCFFLLFHNSLFFLLTIISNFRCF
jgi:E1A/CREB-binding protein